MFSIGDFARTGRVSVRMLRHYDAIGLLPPARVDPVTGYRWYDPDQLARLNRIVALKDLGFTLDQVAVMVDGTIDATELRGMLRLRRLELREQIAADTARLARVESRLRVIEKEDAMSTAEITIKTVPATWVAELSAPVAGFEPQHITPVLGPLFDRLIAGLEATGIPCAGAPIAYYEDAVDADGLTVHACAPVPEDTRLDGEGPDSDAVDHLTLTRLPAITAATILHRGVMDDVMPTIQTLGQWIGEHGHRSAGYNREVYLRYGKGMPEPWETELQEPLITG